MRLIRICLLSVLVGLSSLVYAEGIQLNQLPKVTGFITVDEEGEQYIAATDRGLFYSLDYGHTWVAYEGYALPATMVSTTPQGTVYAFVVTKGLLLLNNDTNQWKLINNNFGSQILRQLSTTSWSPTRLVALNQYGKFLVSENYGNDWQNLKGPYQAASPAEERGQNLYAKNCQSCHGKDGVGENYSIQALTDKKYIMAPALDASAHAWHHTDEALVRTILDGSPRTQSMIAWKNKGLTEQNAEDLVAYITSLWTQRELDCQGPKHMQCMGQ
jgi:mono/diheme cytochrome c family protein